MDFATRLKSGLAASGVGPDPIRSGSTTMADVAQVLSTDPIAPGGGRGSKPWPSIAEWSNSGT
jgi:hypothetical protein